ncbi:dihydrofolate reductase [Nocardioides terrisoli]|uniref:dihydrofolate reductase n=1 Tax=Nocardioides terrisoli TaxID=3388267 RepID=UPI00287B6E96|nr:dihydrofolate reductase [Nocardioides marmorisolisilvae]
MTRTSGPAGGRRVILVAAVADNGVIGAAGAIPWHLSADFAHFKEVTRGHTLVMGRATFDSIGRPLPGRPNIVVTRNPAWTASGVQVAGSLAGALQQAAAYDGDVAVIGGAGVYAEALPLADLQVLTEVHLSPVGDTHYPAFDRAQWREVRREPGPDGPVGYEWVWLERVRDLA